MSRKSLIVAACTFLLSTTPVIAVTNADLRVQTAASRAAASEAKREEIKANTQARREKIKANVQAMRDARKQKVVERVQERLGNVNERRTEHFDRVLDRISTILDKIGSRTEKAKAEGKNVASIESAIASARTAISTAQSAVDERKTKTYQITVTDDGTAKGEVEVTIKQLHADLKTVYDTVAAARQAVHNVFQQIKTVVGETP